MIIQPPAQAGIQYDQVAHSILRELGKALGQNVPDYQGKFSILVSKVEETPGFFLGPNGISNAEFFMRRWLTDLIKEGNPDIYDRVPKRFTLGASVS